MRLCKALVLQRFSCSDSVFCHCSGAFILSHLLILVCIVCSRCLPFESFACNWIQSVLFYLFFRYFSSRLVAWSLFFSTHYTCSQKPFRYLIFHINTQFYLCIPYVRTFCLCVKLSRNAALTPQFISFSLTHSSPFVYLLTSFYLDKLFFSVHFCICSLFKAILFSSLLSFLLALSFNLNLVIGISPSHSPFFVLFSLYSLVEATFSQWNW